MLSDLEAAYDRGEDAEGTKLTVEKNLDTGASTWSSLTQYRKYITGDRFLIVCIVYMYKCIIVIIK